MALNRPEPAPMASVARLLAMDRTTLTAALKALDHRGLATVTVDPQDRRARLLSLTGAGRANLAAAVPIWCETDPAVEAALVRLAPDALRAALCGLG